MNMILNRQGAKEGYFFNSKNPAFLASWWFISFC
jgi:hypothetical protein